MVLNSFVARGGLSYVDRLDFTRGDTARVVRRLAWPTVGLRATDTTLTFSSRTGADTVQHAQVTAQPHRPFYGRFPLPASAVSFEVEGRDQVLLFWTPRVGAVLRGLAKLGWDAEDHLHD
ncbi:hypothetical protein [Micromonospora sp. NPDC049301]|uniref:hypothetical protein n=1 Tax=Micromonospora sp. NPDC049301 TaxID=3155723 RepID=UPI00343D93EC